MKRFNFHSTLNFSLLPSATKLRRLCFYTCVSVHRGVWLSARWDTTPPPPQEQAPPPPGAGTHPTPKQTATVADGTHPTGMHSCSLQVYILKYELSIQSGFSQIHNIDIIANIVYICSFLLYLHNINVRKCK